MQTRIFQVSSIHTLMRKLLLILLLLTGGMISAQTLPIDFETGTFTFTDFDGGQATVLTNPDQSGINTSANCAQMIKNAGQVWGGSLLEMAAPIDFSVNKIFKVKVWSPRVGARLLLKVEDLNNGGIFFEKEDTTTVANAWEELTFDYSTINTSNSYQKIVFIFDLGTAGDGSANFTFYFDDIQLVASSGPILNQIDLPITFEDTMTDYTMTDFGGNASMVVADPTNSSNTVAQVEKTAAAQLWAGTTMSTGNGLANAIPFSAGNTIISVAVWSPDAGIPIRLKAEDKTAPTISVETETNTTVASAWEVLEFDFSNEVSGTAAIDFNNTYDLLSIFFNFGTDGATAGAKTYYFDDVYFGILISNDVGLGTEVSYFPNPAHDRVAVRSDINIDQVQVFNLVGQKVIDMTPASNEVTVDVSMLEAGMYIFVTESEGQRDTFRVIKE